MSQDSVQVIVTLEGERHDVTVPLEWADVPGEEGSHISLTDALARAGEAVLAGMAAVHNAKAAANPQEFAPAAGHRLGTVTRVDAPVVGVAPDGEEDDGGSWRYAASYTPAVGDRVLLTQLSTGEEFITGKATA